MNGVLTNEKPEIRGFLSVTGAIKGVIRTSVPELRGFLSSDLPDKPVYAGPHEVTPAAESVVLDTDDKVVVQDIVVNPIPYYETTNESGGYTVIIG